PLQLFPYTTLFRSDSAFVSSESSVPAFRRMQRGGTRTCQNTSTIPGACMKGFATPALLALTLVVSPGTAFAADSAYIEFLWQPAPRNALARGEAFGFVMDPAQHHVVCVEAGEVVTAPSTLRIDVIDASGADVAALGDGSFQGAKKCYRAMLPPTATPGEWTFNVYVDDVLLGTKTIEVARTLDEAPFHSDPRRPYVLG